MLPAVVPDTAFDALHVSRQVMSPRVRRPVGVTATHDDVPAIAPKDDFPDTAKGATYDALISVLKMATERGSQHCSIQCSSIADPDISADRVFISCDGGKRSILIVKGKHLSTAHGMKPGTDWYSIDERIGEEPYDKN